MRAMVLEHGGPGAQLQALERPVPAPMGQDVLLRVLACGVCRTDLHLLDGELPAHRRPVVPGHEIVGAVVAVGAGVNNLRIGARVGVPWLAVVAPACIVVLAGKTCAMPPVSPATTAMAAMPSTCWPTPATVCRYPIVMTTCMRHRCCAQDS